MNNDTRLPPYALNRIGQSFGRWTVIDFAGYSGASRINWLCRCSCGTIRPVRQDILLNGTSTSCGCWQRENARRQQTIHGMYNSSEYSAWQELVYRCTKPNHKAYPNYGGRGITVCDRWRDNFQNFFDDMGPRPSTHHSIDRIDNNAGYSPENCRWATTKEQTRNTRYNTPIVFNGRTQILEDWAKELGMTSTSLVWRLRNWPVERAMTESAVKRNYHKRNAV